MKKACVFLADGCEECEALLVVDLLRRAGVTVVTAALGEGLTVHTSHGIALEADAAADDLDFTVFDAVILPGGAVGTANLAASAAVASAVRGAAADGKLVAAVCAAPSVLAGLGLLEGRRATCHPSFEEKMRGAVLTREPVTEDGDLITGRGLGAGIPFALALVRRLVGEQEAEKIAQAIVYPFAW